MHRRFTPALTLAAALAAASAEARAEEITTRSGTVYEGRLVSETSTHYVLETKDFGTLKIAKVDVVKAPGGATPKARAGGPAGTAGGAAKSGPDTTAPAADRTQPLDPEAEAAAAAAKADADRRAAEEAAALDAQQRIERRKAAKIKRRTDPSPAGATAEPVAATPTPTPTPTPPTDGPAADAPPAAANATDPAAESAPATPPAAGPAVRATRPRTPRAARTDTARSDDTAPPAADDRSILGGALLAKTPVGSNVIVFEPPHPFDAAPAGIELGHRTYGQLAAVGTATASVAWSAGGAARRLPVRLADVQRHIEVKSPSQRMRMLEGIGQGDWLRIVSEDGSVASGRLVGLDDATARLAAPGPDGSSVETPVDMTRAVRLDGLMRNTTAHRALGETEPDEPVAVTLWPDGTLHVGRVTGHVPGLVRLDVDGDRVADVEIATEGPIGDVRRIPGAAREKMREVKTGDVVRVRGYEDFPDARVERTWTGPVRSVTAFALCIQLDDGAAVVPFDSLVSVDKIAFDPYRNQEPHRVAADQAGIPVLPGVAATDAATVPKGVSALTDGAAVTHVYVTPPFDGTVFGVRVGCGIDDALAGTDLAFATAVVPKQDSRGVRPREMISESVDGLRVVVYVTPQDVVSAVEISRR